MSPGIAGYIGSHIVKSLVEHGYTVRACARDAANLANLAYLNAMNSIGPRSVTLHTCDLTAAGAYDEASTAALVSSTPPPKWATLRVRRHGATEDLRRRTDARPAAARLAQQGGNPSDDSRTPVPSQRSATAPEGHVYTEDSWADMNQEQRREGSTWDMDTVAHSREVTYAMTKVETERYVYAEGAAHGFEAFGARTQAGLYSLGLLDRAGGRWVKAPVGTLDEAERALDWADRLGTRTSERVSARRRLADLKKGQP